MQSHCGSVILQKFFITEIPSYKWYHISPANARGKHEINVKNRRIGSLRVVCAAGAKHMRAGLAISVDLRYTIGKKARRRDGRNAE